MDKGIEETKQNKELNGERKTVSLAVWHRSSIEMNDSSVPVFSSGH